MKKMKEKKEWEKRISIEELISDESPDVLARFYWQNYGGFYKWFDNLDLSIYLIGFKSSTIDKRIWKIGKSELKSKLIENTRTWSNKRIRDVWVRYLENDNYFKNKGNIDFHDFKKFILGKLDDVKKQSYLSRSLFEGSGIRFSVDQFLFNLLSSRFGDEFLNHSK